MFTNSSVLQHITNLQSLYQSFQSLDNKVEMEYDRQKVVSLEVERKNIELIETRDILIHKITRILELINHQIKSSVCKKSIDLQTVNTKFQSKNKNAQLIIQNQYYFKIPSFNFDLDGIQLSDGIQSVIKQFDNQYESDKNNLQNQITKLKILIKLAQMNKDDSITKASKGRKNQ